MPASHAGQSGHLPPRNPGRHQKRPQLRHLDLRHGQQHRQGQSHGGNRQHLWPRQRPLLSQRGKSLLQSRRVRNLIQVKRTAGIKWRAGAINTDHHPGKIKNQPQENGPEKGPFFCLLFCRRLVLGPSGPARTPHHPARQSAGMFAISQHMSAVHKYMFYPA